MTKDDQVVISNDPGASGNDRIESDFAQSLAGAFGSPTPRIHTPLNDLPSRGFEIIDFAASLKMELMPWQKFVLEHSHKIKPDGKYATPLVCTIVSRQSGKSTLMLLRILAGMYLFDEPLQISSAHRLTTSLEQFRTLVGMIESSDELSKKVQRIKWSHGNEEITIQGKNGVNRFAIKAGGSAARGTSPTTVHLDELREQHDLDSFASLRYSLLAAKNPMIMSYSSAGDQHSLVLNLLRDRGIAAAAGATDNIAYFEWSAPTDDVNDPANIIASVPALGHTIHLDNIEQLLNDPPSVVQTEVLSRWVATITSAVDETNWRACISEDVDLDPEKITWMALDHSPDRRHAALVAAQQLPNDQFIIKLLHTWSNDSTLDDKAIANDAAAYCRKYPIEFLAYSRRTSAAVADRMRPAGIPVLEADSFYPQSCDELLSAINSGRLRHRNQEQLNLQMLSAVKLHRGDGGMVLGRRASQSAICAAVASALVTHFATRPSTDVDILIG
jgi:phage terminase large subunit-like protein